MDTRTNGFTMHWEEYGQGEPLLLIHGFPLSAEMWKHQRHLPGIRVITPDMRGFGKSEATEGVAHMGLMADDLESLLTYLNLDQVTIGGMSMGGYVALAFAAKYPERMKGLILIDTRAEEDTPEGKQNRQKMIETAKREGAKTVAEQMEPRLWTKQNLEKRGDDVEMMHAIMLTTPVTGIVAAVQGMAERPDMTDYLPMLDAPTLVIVGTEDQITPPSASEKMKTLIPNTELVIIPNAAHMAVMEQPDAVNQAIVSFMNKVRQNHTARGPRT